MILSLPESPAYQYHYYVSVCNLAGAGNTHKNLFLVSYGRSLYLKF